MIIDCIFVMSFGSRFGGAPVLLWSLAPILITLQLLFALCFVWVGLLFGEVRLSPLGASSDFHSTVLTDCLVFTWVFSLLGKVRLSFPCC